MEKNNPFTSIIHKTEDGISFFALILIALLPTLEVILRPFKTGIHSSSEYVMHLVIWIAFLGAMITSREDRHLSLSVGVDLINEPIRSWIKTLIAFLSVIITTFLTISAFSFIQVGFMPEEMVGIIPISIIMSIIAIGYTVMLIRFIGHAPKGIICKFIVSSGIIVAWGMKFLPIDFYALATLPCSIILIIAALLGMPIFLFLAGFSLLFFHGSGGEIMVIPNEAYTMLTGQLIPAIPLFTLAGFILSESNAGERLVRLFRALFGWMPGGLAIATIIICTFFTALTGASGVTILALGGLLTFVLKENGYKKDFRTGLMTVNGIGTLFPPSLPLIMYGVVAHISIKKMFIASLLPGSIMVLALIIYVVIVAKKKKIPRSKFNIYELFESIKESFWEILIPVIIIFFYFGGFTTLVETGAITTVYILLIELFINRDLSIKKLPNVFVKSMPIMGGVLIILASAKALSYYIVDAEVPMLITEWMQQYVHSKWLFLLLLNIVLLITGCLMDVFSAIIVLIPLIIPLGEAYGVDPIHLGIIFLANLEVGYLTPPVGINLFLASFRFQEPLINVYKAVVPFLIVMLISVLVITYIPWISTAMVDLFNF